MTDTFTPAEMASELESVAYDLEAAASTPDTYFHVDRIRSIAKKLRDPRPGETTREKAQVACSVPPEGWYCTRKAGHDGPCAALPKQQADETLRVMHARKQGAADGFQQGWHAALSRVSEGDSSIELAKLVPTPREPQPSSELMKRERCVSEFYRCELEAGHTGKHRGIDAAGREAMWANAPSSEASAPPRKFCKLHSFAGSESDIQACPLCREVSAPQTEEWRRLALTEVISVEHLQTAIHLIEQYAPASAEATVSQARMGDLVRWLETDGEFPKIAGLRKSCSSDEPEASGDGSSNPAIQPHPHAALVKEIDAFIAAATSGNCHMCLHHRAASGPEREQHYNDCPFFLLRACRAALIPTGDR